MRVVDVHTKGDPPIDVMLHPRLTVLTGSRAECSALAESLARAFVEAGTGVTGSVEYSSFHMPLDQTTIISLDLPGEGFRVITSMDLPEVDVAAGSSAVDDLEVQRLGWVQRLADASAGAQELRRRLDATAAGVEVGRQELEQVVSSISDLEAQAEVAADRPQQLAAEIEAGEAAIAAAEVQIGVVAELAPEVASLFDPESESVRGMRIGVDPVEHRQLLERAVQAGLLEESRYEELTAWLRAIAEGNAEPNPALVEMLDEVEVIESRWAELSRVGVEDEPEVIEARERLEMLDNRLVALQELAASGILADRARDEIDGAHAERTRLEGERHSRSGDLDGAVAEEQRVLGTYGFDSFLEYTIALSTRSVGEAVNGTLERVGTEKVGAADALEAVRGQAAAKRAALSEERASLRERIHLHSGVAADDLTVDVISSIPDLPASLETLVREMSEAVATAEARRGELAEALRVLLTERDSGVDVAADLRASAASQRLVADSLAGLVERAAQELAGVQDELADADRVVEESAERLSAIESELATLGLQEGETYSAAEVTALVAGLTPLIDPPGPDPIPVLMVEALTPLGPRAAQALEEIMSAARRVQLVYVTDDPRIVEWADLLGPNAGQLVRLDRPSWLRRRLARRHSRREHQDR